MPKTFNTETSKRIPEDSVILRAMERQQSLGVPSKPRHEDHIYYSPVSHSQSLGVPPRLRHEDHVCCSPILQNPIWAPDPSYLQLPPNGIYAAHDRLQLALVGPNGSSTTSPSNVQSREHSFGARTETERSSSCSSMSSQQHKSAMDCLVASPNGPKPLLGQEIKPMLPLPTLKHRLGKKAFNKYVYVLLDGDSHMFPDDIVEQGFQGGRRTGKELHSAVEQYLRARGVELSSDLEILIYIWCDATKLAREYVSAGITPKFEGLLHFRTGFEYSGHLIVNCDVRPSEKNEVLGNFLQALQDPDCVRIVLASSTFDAFKDLLESHTKTNPLLTIMLEKIDPYFESDLFLPCPKIIISRLFNTCLKRSEAREASKPIPTPSKSADTGRQRPPEAGEIKRNKEGKRIDPHLKIPDNALDTVKLRRPKLCNNYHLRGSCIYGNTCGYRHGYLSDADRVILREVAREQPCRNGPACAEPTCFAGHRCLRRSKCGDACRFPREMHFKDTNVVYCEEGYPWAMSAFDTDSI